MSAQFEVMSLCLSVLSEEEWLLGLDGHGQISSQQNSIHRLPSHCLICRNFIPLFLPSFRDWPHFCAARAPAVFIGPLNEAEFARLQRYGSCNVPDHVRTRRGVGVEVSYAVKYWMVSSKCGSPFLHGTGRTQIITQTNPFLLLSVNLQFNIISLLCGPC